MNDREPPMTRLRSRLQTCAAALLLAGATLTTARAAEVTFVLAIANGHVPANMRLIRVKQNDVVKLQWSTDKAIPIHLHGYDIEKDLKPGTIPLLPGQRVVVRFDLASKPLAVQAWTALRQVFQKKFQL